MNEQQGWLLNGKKDVIWLTKGANKVKFDMVVPTNKGLLFAMYFSWEAEIATAAATDKPQRISIKEAQNKIGHSNEDSTCKTAAKLGIKSLEASWPLAMLALRQRQSKRMFYNKAIMCQQQAQTDEFFWTLLPQRLDRLSQSQTGISLLMRELI
jgi:hypothetical protein